MNLALYSINISVIFISKKQAMTFPAAKYSKNYSYVCWIFYDAWWLYYIL
jgi:hypothetical protein